MLPIIGIVLIPGILWGWAFYHAQRYKKVHLPLLSLLFLCGMAAGMPALLLNHAVEKYTLFWPEALYPQIQVFGKSIPLLGSGFWFLVGMNEEFAKLLFMTAVVYPSRHLQESFDGILYAAVVALGFATIENAFYLDRFGVAVVITRTVITLPAHAFMSVPMGYFVAKSRLQLDSGQESRPRYHRPMMTILQGWGISVLLHGSYDFWLSLKMEQWAYTQIILMGGLTVWLGHHALRKNRLTVSGHKFSQIKTVKTSA